jgi:hypothetical protein
VAALGESFFDHAAHFELGSAEFVAGMAALEQTAFAEDVFERDCGGRLCGRWGGFRG